MRYPPRRHSRARLNAVEAMASDYALARIRIAGASELDRLERSIGRGMGTAIPNAGDDLAARLLAAIAARRAEIEGAGA